MHNISIKGMGISFLFQHIIQSLIFTFFASQLALEGRSSELPALFSGMIGFASIGFSLAIISFSAKKIDMRIPLGISFVLVLIPISLLLFKTENAMTWFSILNGISLGMFWGTRHSMELTHIKDENKDTYLSTLSIGAQISSILIPSVLGFLAAYLFKDTQSQILMFVIILIAIIPGILAVYWTPKTIIGITKTSDIIQCAKTTLQCHITRKYVYFWLFDAFSWTIRLLAFPLLVAASVSHISKLALFETMGATSAILILFFITRKIKDNKHRGRACIISSGLSSSAWIVAGVLSNPIGLAILSFAKNALQPISDGTSHSMSHKGAELIAEKSNVSNMAVMLYREWILAIGRFVFLIPAIVFPQIVQSTSTLVWGVSASVCLLGLAFFAWIITKEITFENPAPLDEQDGV